MKQRSTLSSSYRPALLLLAVITAACSESRAPLNAPQASADLQATNPIPGIGDQLGRLRSLTARFHDFDSTTQPGGEYSRPDHGLHREQVVGRRHGFPLCEAGHDRRHDQSGRARGAAVRAADRMASPGWSRSSSSSHSPSCPPMQRRQERSTRTLSRTPPSRSGRFTCGSGRTTRRACSSHSIRTSIATRYRPRSASP